MGIFSLSKYYPTLAESGTRACFAILGIIFALNVLLGWWLGFTADSRHLDAFFILWAILITIIVLCVRYRTDRRIADTALCFLLIVISAPAINTLTYISAALNFPLQDTRLVAIDRALGFDWHAWLAFTLDHPFIRDWTNTIYHSTTAFVKIAILLVPIVYGVRNAKIFVLAFGLTGLVTAILFAPMIAMGPYPHYGVSVPDLHGFIPAALEREGPVEYLDIFIGLRDGTYRTVSLADMHGIVVFPSFHSVLSVLLILCYVGRTRLQHCLLAVSVVINLMVLATVPISGGHYFADIIAGLIIGLAGWYVAVRIVDRQPRTSSATVPVPEPIPAQHRGA